MGELVPEGVSIEFALRISRKHGWDLQDKVQLETTRLVILVCTHTRAHTHTHTHTHTTNISKCTMEKFQGKKYRYTYVSEYAYKHICISAKKREDIAHKNEW